MNTRLMALAVREVATQLRNAYIDDDGVAAVACDAIELLRGLARILEGHPLARAFGTPGDYGYETSIGKALAAPGDVGQLAGG